MHSLFVKKTLGGLAVLLVAVGMFVYPGAVRQVGATGGYNSFIASAAKPNSAAPLVTNASTYTIISTSASWKYFSSSTAAAAGWNTPSFDDSTWKVGKAPLGYGNGNEATVMSYGSDPNHKYNTAYFRSTFSLTNPGLATALALTLTQDDGAVVYLNGHEVGRSNMPAGTPAYTTAASVCGENMNSTINVDPKLLVAGTNVLAVEVHQCNGSSSDLTFNGSLVATLGTTAPTQAPTAPAADPTTAPTDAPTAAPTADPTDPPVVPTDVSTGNSFYVATNGSASGNGSITRPWDLKTACAMPSVVRPGDTIWVRGGTYKYRNVAYLYCNLRGAAGLPVTLRAVPGERAIIDASIALNTPYATIWGLEFIDSNPTRTDGTNNSRNNSFTINGANDKLINNIVHDAGGFGFWYPAVNAEMYGNLIYNNGSMGSDRGHGHGIYTTNQTGSKLIADNVLFNSFSGINIHAYSEKTYLNGFRFDGNVSFNGRFLVGGLVPTSNVTLTNNMTYRGRTDMGYSTSVTNKNLTVSGNTFEADNEDALRVFNYYNFNVASNKVINRGAKLGILGTLSSHSTYAWNSNAYYSTSTAPFALNGAAKTWTTWRSGTGFDGSSALYTRMPTGVQVIVRPNKYESGRGNVVVYNWDKKASVTVDISKLGYKVGQTYVIHNAQNYFAETIRGTYTGAPITVRMTGWTIAKPAYWSTALKPTTFPEFGAFIISRY